jgi:hypothetical protein
VDPVAQGPLETTVEIGTEFRVRRVRGRRQGTHDDLASGRKPGEAFSGEMAQLALDTMTDHGVAHGSADHEPEPGRWHLRLRGSRCGFAGQQVHHQGAAATATAAP